MIPGICRGFFFQSIAVISDWKYGKNYYYLCTACR
jgi:hypothetical protein